MSTTTRLVAAIMITASFGAVLATGSATLFDRDAPVGDAVRSQAAFHEVPATIRTEWLTPVSARRSLEQRLHALERWVAERGGSVRILGTDSVMRTRDTAGARLKVPLAQLERTLSIHVPPQHQAADLEQALAGLDATVASVAPDTDAVHPSVEF